MLHSDLTADDLQQIQQKVPEAEILGVSIDETFFQDFPETDRYPRQIYYRIFAAHAYEIQKMREGFYYFIQFEGASTVPAEVESRVRIIENVVRYLCVRQDEA